jgi:hypothetical protein
MHVASPFVATPNAPPENSVPGAQETAEDVALVFSAANGNAISVSDPDAGSNDVQVTLTATNGTLTLNTIAGLSFSAGDGSGDATMTFTGTQAAINTALNGLTFTPAADFSGAALVTIETNDLGNSGTGGPLSDTDSVSITVLTPEEQAEDLGEAIADLVADGSLTSGVGNALTSKLENALAKIEQGKLNAAINMLNAFISQVISLVADGTLTEEEGAALIAAAQEILASITT